MSERPSIGLTLEGFYKVAVVDSITGKEVWRQPKWEKNLILNQGMDAIASRTPVECFEYGVAGTGVRFNSIQGGQSSGSAINGMFSLLPIGSGIQDFNSTTYGGWVGGVLAPGDIFKMEDGTEVMVSGVGDVSASINTTDTVASQSFVIWKTSQTGLQSEISRSGNGSDGLVSGTGYYFGEGMCSTTTSSYHRFHHLRTFDFRTETFTRTYTEVGVAWDRDDSPVPSTFSRMLLLAPLTVSGSQRLRLIYQLNVCYTPESASVVVNPPIEGWPVTPATNTTISQSIQGFNWQSFVQSNSGQTAYASYSPLDPSTSGWGCAFFGSTHSASLVTLGTTPINRQVQAYVTSSVKDPYVPGSYRLTKSATWPKWVMNHTTLRTFGIGNDVDFVDTAYSTTGQHFLIRFEQSQSKFDNETLTMRYLWTWNRVLAN